VVKRVLHSLSCGKFKLLNKNGRENKVDAADRFESNRTFKSKVIKFTVPMASLDSRLQIKNKVSFAINFLMISMCVIEFRPHLCVCVCVYR